VAHLRRLNPAHVAAIAETVNKCPYFTLLSMEVKGLEAGKSRLEVEVQKKHFQPYGLVHGGVYASLIDAAIYWAVYAGMEETKGLTTVELKINYLKPVSEGGMRARGSCLKIGRNICLGEGSIEDRKGEFLAHGTATLMIVDSLEIQGHSKLPPKFLD
jgi:uncharacterized protein (TIGR00369 family)